VSIVLNPATEEPLYGLSGSIWTRDETRALRVARAIESFGGFKQNGFGRELGVHAIDGYSEVKNISYSTEG